MAKIIFLENLRRQVLQVVLILTLGAVASTTLLSFFDVGVQVKILKDLSLAAILFCGGVMAITISVGSVSAEVQSRTAYPILARPVRRPDYILAIYLGMLATCLLCMALIGIVFLGILGVYEKAFDTAVAMGIGYVCLEVALVAAVGMFFGTFLSPMVSATLTLFVFILGQVKAGYLHSTIDRVPSSLPKVALMVFYYLLPNLESFSFKDALVHNIPVPVSYLWLVGVYGVMFVAIIISFSGMVFSRRQL